MKCNRCEWTSSNVIRSKLLNTSYDVMAVTRFLVSIGRFPISIARFLISIWVMVIFLWWFLDAFYNLSWKLRKFTINVVPVTESQLTNKESFENSNSNPRCHGGHHGGGGHGGGGGGWQCRHCCCSSDSGGSSTSCSSSTGDHSSLEEAGQGAQQGGQGRDGGQGG